MVMGANPISPHVAVAQWLEHRTVIAGMRVRIPPVTFARMGPLSESDFETADI